MSRRDTCVTYERYSNESAMLANHSIAIDTERAFGIASFDLCSRVPGADCHAIDEAGNQDQTTLFVVSDQGFQLLMKADSA